jgi:hypothetical protein
MEKIRKKWKSFWKNVNSHCHAQVDRYKPVSFREFQYDSPGKPGR